MLMVKKVVLSVFAALTLGCFVAPAQGQRISGTVTDQTGQPVIGASVTVEGTTRGVTTVADGHYEIAAQGDATLKFSFLGYESQLVPVAGRTTIDVVLKDDATAIDDVTVIAYGKKRKEDLVGSVSKVKEGLIANSQASSVTKSLEGAVAGVQIVSGTGQPGSDASIVVRGIGSISAGQTALIVVDGVPFNGSLSDINPADIESMTVSKDAVSNSLYGSRAANGVVMVTTRTGKRDRTRVSFKGTWGVNTRGVPDYDMATDQAEFYELTWFGMRNTYWANNGHDLAAANLRASQDLLGALGNYNAFLIPDGQFLVGTNGRLNPHARVRYDDSFADAMFHNSFRQEYVASVSGGTAKTDYYLSMGYLDDDSYIVGSDYERLTMRANVNTQLFKWLKVGMNISYAKTSSNGLNETSGAAGNPFNVARGWAPIFPVHAYDAEGNMKYNEDGTPMYDNGMKVTDGTLNRPTATNQNIICNLNEDIRKSTYNNLSTRSYAEVKFLRDFTFTVNYAYDLNMGIGTTFYTPTIGDGQSFGGRGTKSSAMAETMTLNQLLAYRKEIGNHHIEALAGHEYYKRSGESLSGQKTQFFDPSNPELDNGGEIQSLGSTKYLHNIEGYFLKADYDFAHRYYLSGAVRRDGTSRFLDRWGTFWSVGAAWRLSTESFMAGASSWLDDLKLRASYGTQGNENIGTGYMYTPYQDQWAVSWDGTSLGISQAFYGNPDLTWEKQKTFDVGVDFSFFGRRLYGNIDYFYRRTDDMLYQRTKAMSSGRPYNWENIGDMQNQGVEFEINVDAVKRRDVQLTVSLIGSHYRNKVLSLPEEYKENGLISVHQRLFEGKSRYEYYMYRYAGVNEEGQPLWYYRVLDDKGNPTGELATTSDYNKVSGSPIHKFDLGKSALPDFQGGLNIALRLYGFDLSIATAFQIGGYVYDGKFAGTMSSGFYGGHNRELWNTWNPETMSGEYGIWNNQSQSSSFTQSSDLFLTSASYFSIRNITLGYTFPTKWMQKLGIESARVFVVADNVALFSARKGLDPRTSMSGQADFGGYAQIRTISGGINLNF